MDMDTYFERIQIIIEYKYGISDDILCDYLFDIEQFYNMGLSPRRAVEALAKIIYETE